MRNDLPDDTKKYIIDEITAYEETIKPLEKVFPKGCPIEIHWEWEGKFKTAKVDHVEIDELRNNRIHFIYDDDIEKEVRWIWWNESGIGITGPWIEKMA